MTLSKGKIISIIKLILSHNGIEFYSMCDQFEILIQKKLNYI